MSRIWDWGGRGWGGVCVLHTRLTKMRMSWMTSVQATEQRPPMRVQAIATTEEMMMEYTQERSKITLMVPPGTKGKARQGRRTVRGSISCLCFDGFNSQCSHVQRGVGWGGLANGACSYRFKCVCFQGKKKKGFICFLFLKHNTCNMRYNLFLSGRLLKCVLKCFAFTVPLCNNFPFVIALSICFTVV